MRLIDADMLIKFMRANIDHHIKLSNNLWIARDDLLRVIENARTIDASPVEHAHWEKASHNNYKCTNCDDEWTTEWIDEMHFCPHCGARMDGDPHGEGA